MLAIEDEASSDLADQAVYGVGADLSSLFDGSEHDDIKEAAQAYANQARTFAEARRRLNDVRVA